MSLTVCSGGVGYNEWGISNVFFSLGQFHSWHFTVCGWRGNAQNGGDQSRIAFATIPLLFGMQQLIEGVIWLTFSHDAPLLRQVMAYLYSGFSHVLWPMYVPFAAGLLEAVRWRKKAIFAFEAAGVAVGLYLLYFIVTSPVVVEVIGSHIVYLSPHFYVIPMMMLYLAVTCFSCFLSSHGFVRLFGVLRWCPSSQRTSCRS